MRARIRETKTIQQLKQNKRNLTQQNQELEYRLKQLERKRDQLRTAVQTEDQHLRNKIETELIRLKDRKPELFYITDQEQLSKIKAQLGISIIRWLIK